MVVDKKREDGDAASAAPEPELSADMMALLGTLLNATGLLRVRRSKPRKRP